MADESNIPVTFQEYHVLVMAATEVVVHAESPELAHHIAARRAREIIDPQQVQWVVRAVSDRPFEIADPDDTPEARAAAEADAARQQVTASKIQLLS